MHHHPDADYPRDIDRNMPEDHRTSTDEDGVLEELRREAAELHRAQGLRFGVNPSRCRVDLSLTRGRGDPPPDKGERGKEGGVEACGSAGEMVGVDAEEGVLGVGGDHTWGDFANEEIVTSTQP